MNTNLIMGLLTQLVAALTPVPATNFGSPGTNLWLDLSFRRPLTPALITELGPTNYYSTADTIRAWAKSGDLCRVLDHHWVPGIRVGAVVVVTTCRFCGTNSMDPSWWVKLEQERTR